MAKTTQRWPNELKGMVNAYSCRHLECRRVTPIILLDDGTTPFGIRCPHCEHSECFSQMYTLSLTQPKFKLKIEHAFFRPTLEWINARPYAADTREFVRGGAMVHASLVEALENRLELNFEGLLDDKDRFDEFMLVHYPK